MMIMRRMPNVDKEAKCLRKKNTECRKWRGVIVTVRLREL